MQGYTETILKYAADNSHSGLLDNPDGTGEVGLSGQKVGTRLAVRFTLKIDNNYVKDIRFQVFGCGFTIAACAAAAELSEGHSLQEVRNYTPAVIDKQLGGLPAERDYCAALANQALQAALSSVQKGATPVTAELDTTQAEEHGQQLNPTDPLYLALLKTPNSGRDAYDRKMFAGLLTIASHEPCPLNQALGLTPHELTAILTTYFPTFDQSVLAEHAAKTATAPAINPDILKILLSHVPCDATGGMLRTSEWLAQIIAARSAHPGHLWLAMGFLERPELTAAIRRHLPTLAAANSNGMRWKRYLFKQVCDLNGGVMCKSPNCGDCSDYALCFAPEDD